MPEPPAACFSELESNAANDAWRFNCGPASVCLLWGLRPDVVRPHFVACGFERKGYTNPTLMYHVLSLLGKTWRLTRHPDAIPHSRGIARIQWVGPWNRDGVPPQAAYRHTHWIAFWYDGEQQWIGDVNAMCVGGWITMDRWHHRLVPWLLEKCEPKASGLWFPAQVLEVDDA